ncbi:MAG: BrnT family toxin [Rhodospirillaceae bacterium]|nr:BrnT family toxin [Rhodospirillaceae bacterium]
MVDLDQISGFDWDDGNARKSIEKHGVDRTEAEQVFFNVPLLLMEDMRHSTTEKRFHAYGRSNDGRLLQVSFTLRQMGTRIRVISARPMHRKERTRYDEET